MIKLTPNDVKDINVNGYDTYYVDVEDKHGKYLCIYIPEHADKDISDICGKFIAGHLIESVDYQKNQDGKIFAIKAYY